MATPLRRVITGTNADGQSCILIDDLTPGRIWRTHETPADNSGTEDTAGDSTMSFPTEGSSFGFYDFPADNKVFLHATDTLDYVVVVSGEITLVTQTGEATLRAGDVAVDRGIIHGWRNDSGAPCRVVSVMLPSLPVGKGATVTGTLKR